MAWNQPGNRNNDPWRGKDPNREVQAFVDRLRGMFGGSGGGGRGGNDGFNPLYLRLAFIAPLFFFPVQTFAAYFALGGIVLASRLIFPARTAPAETEAETETRTPQTEEMALAA